MAALTCAQVKPAGVTETLTCELCFQEFEFTHNGQWLPASCPTCQQKRLAVMGGYQPASKELEAIEEILKLLE